jgi:hypothetical protein
MGGYGTPTSGGARRLRRGRRRSMEVFVWAVVLVCTVWIIALLVPLIFIAWGSPPPQPRTRVCSRRYDRW